MNQTNKDIPAQLEAFAESAKKAGLTSGDRVIGRAIARIAELEAVVEKLHKTADGVPVVKGDRVWAWFRDGLHMVAYRSGDRAHKENPHVCGPRIESCYSTREAALAAKEVGDAPE